MPEWIKFELQYNSEFNKDVSTVTYFAENETYIISNTIVYGFATGASFNYLEVDGVRYTVARIPYDYVRNAFVMLYIDQAGDVADYVFNADPYVFNLNTRTYHTIECMLYRYSFLENWVTFNEIGNHIKSDDGIAIFVGCTSCHTNGTWKPVTVPTGYVTVDGWNYYHTPTCSYIVETTKEVIPVTNILTTTLQRHECCGNH